MGKKITILGSTGSIGVQSLDVISKTEGLQINILTTNTRIDILEMQLDKITPKAVVITDENSYKNFKQITKYKGEVLFGEEGLLLAASDKENDLVISALVGFAGVSPTASALKNGINVALANKETLVSAGEYICSIAKKYGSDLIAIDSEHSAILQCLTGEKIAEVEKLILTASGGPFRSWDKKDFDNITLKDALNHPNWSMGSKITIDSATMMNKGLEVIEAKWLFDLAPEKIDILIHPQSIIHSLVQFYDGSVKAQLGLPDMRIPISYALNYPRHLKYDFPRLDLSEIGSLTFEKPDFEKFECLKLAYQTLKSGGTATTIMNAANEIAVKSFLNEQIGFNDIPKAIEYTLNKLETIQKPSLDQIVEADNLARKTTNHYISSKL